MDAKTLYTLIAVTYGGNVSQTPGFESLALCNDASQIAQTGRTVAEERQVEAARRERDAEDARKAEQACKDRPEKWSSVVVSCDGGKVVSRIWSMTSAKLLNPTDVKFARCLIEPPADRP